MNKEKLTEAGVNLAEGIRRMNGREDLYERMLGTFMRDEHLADLQEAVAAGDAGRAFLDAHSLKGMAGNMSMTRLYEALLPLNEELRAGTMGQAESLLPPVLEAYRRVAAAIASD